MVVIISTLTCTIAARIARLMFLKCAFTTAIQRNGFKLYEVFPKFSGGRCEDVVRMQTADEKTVETGTVVPVLTEASDARQLTCKGG